MQLIPFTNDDFKGLYDFMQPLWLKTYGEILPREQILFLVDKFFSKEGLRYYVEQGYQYRKIDDVGVVVFVERENETYMDKLYLLPCARGKGYPAFVFDELAKSGKDVALSVNQANARALKCYIKNGFEVERAVDVDLGNGMVNHDFLMRRKKKV